MLCLLVLVCRTWLPRVIKSDSARSMPGLGVLERSFNRRCTYMYSLVLKRCSLRCLYVILAALSLQRYPCNVNLIPPSRLVVRMRVYVLSVFTLRCCYLSVCLLCWSGCVAVVLITGICALLFGFVWRYSFAGVTDLSFFFIL